MNFAANLTMLFGEHAFLDRFAAAAQAGFSRVEYLFPYDWPAQTLREKLDEHQLEQVLFNLPPGDWSAGERGLACLPGREQEFRESITTALDYAQTLKCPRLHVMAGVIPEGVDQEVVRQTYIDNLLYAAKCFGDVGIDVLIEPLNQEDMPGYFLSSFEEALQLLEEFKSHGQEHLPKLQFDIYHCAKIHGDVQGWIRRCEAVTAHYQIAGVPGRHEPNVGTLPLEDCLRVINEISPDTTIGCEYKPQTETVAGLTWLSSYR